MAVHLGELRVHELVQVAAGPGASSRPGRRSSSGWTTRPRRASIGVGAAAAPRPADRAPGRSDAGRRRRRAARPTASSLIRSAVVLGELDPEVGVGGIAVQVGGLPAQRLHASASSSGFSWKSSPSTALPAASPRTTCGRGLLSRRKGARFAASDSVPMVRSAESSIIEMISLSRTWNSAHACCDASVDVEVVDVGHLPPPFALEPLIRLEPSATVSWPVQQPPAEGDGRPSTPASQRLVRPARARSTPWECRVPSSIQTRSSVARFPVADRAKGQPPRPPAEASNVPDAGLEPGEHVRQGLAVRVVEVQCEPVTLDPRLLDRLEDRGHLTGRRHPDRVAEADLGAPEVDQPPRHRCGLPGIDSTLPRVAETHRHVTAYRQPARSCFGDRRGGHLDRPVQRAAQVFPGEPFGGGDEDRDLVRTGGQRALQTALVRHQDRIADPRGALKTGEELRRVGQLRHPPRETNSWPRRLTARPARAGR